MRALDGDTLLFDDKVVRIAGIDAPELGPSANCWAEAALGGASRNALAEAIEGPLARDWQLAEISAPDDSGRIRAVRAGRPEKRGYAPPLSTLFPAETRHFRRNRQNLSDRFEAAVQWGP
jgi:hypothetical protein